MEITPFRFDHVDNFLAVREFCSPVNLIIAEDNEATIKILLKGRSIKLRHVHRTHRVNLDWLYEIFCSTSCRCRFRYVSTKHQLADIHIKAITKADVWTHLTRLSFLHSVQAGPHLRAKASCLRVIATPKVTMSSSLRAFIGPGSFVYVCPACQSAEEDVNKLKMNTDIPQSVILCCPNCDPCVAVDKVNRSDYQQAVLESLSLNEASQPPLEGVPSAETIPSPPCDSKKE